MDFKDQIKQLGSRIEKLKDSIQTEEATKNAFIMPFLQYLGYDVFDPLEVVPEYTCDIGTKKGEKIDYAIFKDGTPVVLVECKHWKQNLSLHDGQLLRYFHVSKAKFGILTNGIEFRFYSDLVEPNKMDEKPFLELNLLDIKDAAVEEVKKFHKSYFNLESIVTTASELKYMTELRNLITSELNKPSENLVRHFTKQVYSGVVSAKVLESFTDLVKRAFSQTISEMISDRLKSALSNETAANQTPISESAVVNVSEQDGAGKESLVVTTEEELEGYRIVRAILRKTVSVDRIFHRDTQSYFNILLDDNNRKTICRLYLNSQAKRYIGILSGLENKETKLEIKTVDDIYSHADALIQTVINLDNKQKREDSAMPSVMAN